MENPSRVGKYEIEKYLGGSMARVYRARDSVLGRRVALKILSESGMSDPEAKQRFLQEARVASSIRHENIVGVYDFGEDQGRPYIVMEFVEGESLREAIRNNQLGDLRSRLKIALAIAGGVDHIPTRTIIHRDLKPDNIHINAEGKALLMDFGIAKAEGVQLTKVGFTLGTPYYMPPEQVLGKPLTPQADVYAFGILMYELVTGIRPVKEGNIDQIFQAILTEPLNMEPLKALNPPQALTSLIERCTAKQADRRPPGLGEVRAILQAVLQGLPGTSQGVQIPVPPISPAVPQATPQRRQTDVPHLTPPVIATASVASAATMPKPASEGLPKFLEMLPAGLRTQTALMVLSCSAVLVVVVLLVGILKLTNTL